VSALPAALDHALQRLRDGAAIVLEVRVRQEYIGTPLVDLSGAF
jgi:hypothetical protein